VAQILSKFFVEFEPYWNSQEFAPFDPERPEQFHSALARAKDKGGNALAVFFDLRPHPFQERILEALAWERSAHDRWRMLCRWRCLRITEGVGRVAEGDKATY
jgi:hypothetical protein